MSDYINKRLDAIKDWDHNSKARFLVMQCSEDHWEELREAIESAGYKCESERNALYMGPAYLNITIERP